MSVDQRTDHFQARHNNFERTSFRHNKTQLHYQYKIRFRILQHAYKVPTIFAGQKHVAEDTGSNRSIQYCTVPYLIIRTCYWYNNKKAAITQNNLSLGWWTKSTHARCLHTSIVRIRNRPVAIDDGRQSFGKFHIRQNKTIRIA